MSGDTRTRGEKLRDENGSAPQVETLTLEQAMARKRALDAAQRPVQDRLGMGVPPEMLNAAGGIKSMWPDEVVPPSFPVATPLSLVDQAIAVATALERFARSLEGAAEWCEDRAKELPALEAQALRHAASVMRADAAKSHVSCSIEKTDGVEGEQGHPT